MTMILIILQLKRNKEQKNCNASQRQVRNGSRYLRMDQVKFAEDSI